ncbi:MAG: class I SAM-dependent methyltransferase [Candidatus Helarchaeota archaeon]|nr:class I SAM-dependent methyltransferase [Candidatus Helarchaeota archaeon]
MSKLSIKIITLLNKVFKPPKFLSELDEVKLSISAYQAWEYNEIVRIAPEFGSSWNLNNLTVLDAGCGLGGKTVYYEEIGAKQIVGFDIRYPSTKSTFDLSQSRGKKNIRVAQADSACLPFKSDYFDVIISVNVFEHVGDLPATLAECKRVLRAGGLIFLHFPPFYSPWGAHLEGWINFPWANVLFRDKSLLEAAEWIEKNRSKNNDKYIPSAVVEWSRYDLLPGLNRTTIRQFRQLIRKVNLKIKYMKMLPVGREYLKSRGEAAKLGLKLLNGLARLPIVNEVITTKMVFILQK